MQILEASTSAAPANPAKRTLPTVLFFALVALALITVLGFIAAIARGSVSGFVAVGCNLALIFGLLLGHRWAYVLVLLISVAGVAVAFSKGAGSGLLVLLGNGIVVGPVLLSTRYFFPSDAHPRNSDAP